MAIKTRVLVAMSGGVDSSVAAALLLERGYEVIGVTMQIWPDLDGNDISREGGCCSITAVEDARRVANKLGIPYYVMNFKSIFEEKVINYFKDQYSLGKTPNPCIACNRYIKFESLLNRALALDAKFIATGHYATIKFDEAIGRYIIRKSFDIHKDQTYALYNLTQKQLKHILMPLGEYKKEEIRKIASQMDFEVADKPDSQEICFVINDDYKSYLKEEIPDKLHRGYIKDTEGNVLGTHEGIALYTIGQRKGLGISSTKPLYVIDINLNENTVIVGTGDEVYGKGLLAGDTNFIPFDELNKPMEVTAKIRYSAKEARAVINPVLDKRVNVLFEEPQRAITPGQSVVFYKDDLLIGGGIIEKKL